MAAVDVLPGAFESETLRRARMISEAFGRRGKAGWHARHRRTASQSNVHPAPVLSAAQKRDRRMKTRSFDCTRSLDCTPPLEEALPEIHSVLLRDKGKGEEEEKPEEEEEDLPEEERYVISADLEALLESTFANQEEVEQEVAWGGSSVAETAPPRRGRHRRNRSILLKSDKSLEVEAELAAQADELGALLDFDFARDLNPPVDTTTTATTATTNVSPDGRAQTPPLPTIVEGADC